ncbi:MAG: tetratricopeptide repeat protein [Deltaproteobacteria bacterium]|nr:tetratricopeptide repeat protein [Deltaproteobacteria bacterium]
MHPDLLNNSLFLRYYRQWQDDPTSVVFASIAGFLLRYGMLDEALKVCREGLKHHPQLISGHLVLAKIHLTRGNFEEAEETVHKILEHHPRHGAALQSLRQIREARQQEEMRLIQSQEGEEIRLPQHWQTVTMARIFMAQGHTDKARQIYEAILRGEPHNEAAAKGLAELRPSSP